MRKDYKSNLVKQLRDQQTRFAPLERRVQQANRAESLLAELDTEKVYTYDYLCYRITEFRPESFPNARVSGADAIHDVRLLIEDLSDSANIPVDSIGEKVLTVDDLSEMFDVSSKTISRWRQLGLVSRRFVFDGRKRVGFLKSSVDRFVLGNGDRVRRGRSFSQLTENERTEIIHRARRLANAGACPADVAKRLAKRTGRSIETIRYTMKQFDQRNPELAIFPDATGPMSAEVKQRVYQQYRRGTSVENLARRFCRTKTSIYRVVNEMRACRIQELPLDYMYNEEFDQPGIEKKVLAPLPENASVRTSRRPSGLPPYLASLYEFPLLTREQEGHLFRKFNYFKHKANQLREKLDPARAKSSLMDQVEKLYDQAVSTKNQIVRSNLRLVVSIAKRHIGQADNFFELVSDGNMSLIRAVEKFDYARGNKFSTYASWAIMKNYARTIPGDIRQKDRFRTSQDEMFLATPEHRSVPYEQESAQTQREMQIGLILKRLDDREQKIIMSRFGLTRGSEPKTLKEVGADMGVTKERIRQIEARALGKLRVAAQEDRIETP